MASISIRRGKLAPSTRKKPAGAYGASDTNWRIGVDAQSYTTTYTESCSRAREAVYEPRRTINKNASDEVFDGGYSAPPSDPRFTTVTRTELTQSVHTPGYALRRPKEGFDRLTANRTNYSLGQHPAGLTTTTAELQTKHPREQPSVQQPAIGGSTLRDGSYRLDTLSKDSIRRGGGGGEGVLGVRFDIVNAREKDGARGKVGLRTGPRRSLDCAEKRSLHPTDGWGDVPGGTYVDLLTGSDRKLPKAPKRETGVSVRSDTVLGRTRPW